MKKNIKLTNVDKNGKLLPVLHGELTLQVVNEAPEGESKSTKKEILAHSGTGHNHVLESPKAFDYVEIDGDRAVIVKDVARLWHDKTHDIHETIEIKPAVYKVSEAQEYNPFTKVMQRVFD